MDKMNPPMETVGAEMEATESVIHGVVVRAGVSTGVIWMEAIGSGETIVEINEGRMVEVVIAPLRSNPKATQPIARMLITNTAISIVTTIFFSKSDFAFIQF